MSDYPVPVPVPILGIFNEANWPQEFSPLVEGGGGRGFQGVQGFRGIQGYQGVQGIVGPTGSGGGGLLTKMAMALGTTGFIDLQLDAPMKQATLVFRNKGFFDGGKTSLQVGDNTTTYISNYQNAAGGGLTTGFDTSQPKSNSGSTGTTMITNYPQLNSLVMTNCGFVLGGMTPVSGIVDVPNSSTINRIRMIPTTGSYDAGAFITAVYQT